MQIPTLKLGRHLDLTVALHSPALLIASPVQRSAVDAADFLIDVAKQIVHYSQFSSVRPQRA